MTIRNKGLVVSTFMVTNKLEPVLVLTDGYWMVVREFSVGPTSEFPPSTRPYPL